MRLHRHRPKILGPEFIDGEWIHTCEICGKLAPARRAVDHDGVTRISLPRGWRKSRRVLA